MRRRALADARRRAGHRSSSSSTSSTSTSAAAALRERQQNAYASNFQTQQELTRAIELGKPPPENAWWCVTSTSGTRSLSRATRVGR